MKVIILSFDLTGIVYSISYRVVNKLRKAGAVSRDKAMTPETANLNLQEIDWLQYLLVTLQQLKRQETGYTIFSSRYQLHNG